MTRARLRRVTLVFGAVIVVAIVFLMTRRSVIPVTAAEVNGSVFARLAHPPVFGVARLAALEASVGQYNSREHGDWDGMLVDNGARPPCNESTDCGLARACVDGQCQGCDSDRQCAGVEVCSLDHCVLAANSRCRSRRDCAGEGELCVLSGYTGGDPRGNSDMRAYCLSPDSDRGHQTQRQPPAPTPALQVRHEQYAPRISPEGLLQSF